MLLPEDAYGGWIELTSLSDISEEDATEVAKYRYNDPKALTWAQIGKSIIKDYLKVLAGDKRPDLGLSMLEPFEVDFLRSKGYALPWRDLSVDDLIEYGWIKLKTVNP